jgi:cellulose synthase/poly-beta-1,6-N-acetylglucosamine synthase-like glycosyltransferase
MLKLSYPNLEIVVVSDGSKDRTVDALLDRFRLFRSARTPSGDLPAKPVKAVYESASPLNLIVLDKVNGGKADAINVGINYASCPLTVVVDADSLLDPDALLQAVKPFLESPERVIAVGGMVRAVNDCPVSFGRVRSVETSRSYLANCQTVDYLRAFLGGRIGLGFFNAMFIISGAFGLFRKDAVLEAGGFRHDTVGEDMELVVRLHRQMRDKKRSYTIAFVHTPVCWTEVPVTLRVLRRQRQRWQRGTVESILLHREMLFNPRYGIVGLFTGPYFLMFEMCGPLVEFVGYVMTVVGLVFRIIAPEIAILFFTVSAAFGILLSTSALALDQFTRSHHGRPKDFAKLFLVAILENLTLRQLITYFRVQGLIQGLRGKKGNWGAMERRGFSATPRPSKNPG